MVLLAEAELRVAACRVESPAHLLQQTFLGLISNAGN